FQVTPKVSHLYAVKRIFRYLKGQPKLGLWYPKDSPFDLEAYSDSDYAGASLDRKSITGDLLTKALDVSHFQFLIASIGCLISELVLPGKKLMLLGQVSAATLPLGIQLLRFWSTAKIKIVNNETQIHAKVDGKIIVIIESSMRRDLHFKDEDDNTFLTNTKIFENLQLMGYEKLYDKLTYYKSFFSP
ncbi:hypothetical protein Tco_1498325, partial [Tanacetum coccineum]